MKRPHDPLHLDVAAFAADAGRLSGHWPGLTLGRLAETQTPPQDMALAGVTWSAQGERTPVPGGDAEIWLALGVRAPVWLTCQRCLQPFQVPIEFERRLRFVRGEAEAEALDAESEHDVLALSRSLDLRELVEDEVLLALPLVPRHDACPQPLPMSAGELPADDADDAPAHPFAALQALKAASGAKGKD